MLPSELEEVISLTPAIRPRERSSGVATDEAMVSGDAPGSEALMAVLDKLNEKKGQGTLYFAGQGIQQQWQMKRAMLSPRYTTRSSDLLRVK